MCDNILILDDAAFLQRMHDMTLKAYTTRVIEPHFAGSASGAVNRLEACRDVSVVLCDSDASCHLVEPFTASRVQLLLDEVLS